jgi:hypothetical protein
MSEHNISRRSLIKLGCTALAAIPVMSLTGNAFAATNAKMRETFKYQATPKDGKSCANCVQFVAPNGCKAIPGDSEISPSGYCNAYAPKK